MDLPLLALASPRSLAEGAAGFAAPGKRPVSSSCPPSSPSSLAHFGAYRTIHQSRPPPKDLLVSAEEGKRKTASRMAIIPDPACSGAHPWIALLAPPLVFSSLRVLFKK
jgi:hypothetical protein